MGSSGINARVHGGYIGEFEVVDDHRAGKIVINLTGRLNKCGVISPRFDVAIGDIEKWTTNLLPSRQFGYVVNHLRRHHGSRRSQKKASWREDTWFLLLNP